jgi:small subunit ribosomal protein S5
MGVKLSEDFSKKNNLDLREVIIRVNRVCQVTKGGKRFSFNALVVVGDGCGKIGCGFGKSKEVQSAIKKGSTKASKHMISVKLEGDTIPHESIGSFGSSKVLLKPASYGTGIIASETVRAVLNVVGIKNILTKSICSSNSFNVVYATIEALKKLRLKEDILKIRGKEVLNI